MEIEIGNFDMHRGEGADVRLFRGFEGVGLGLRIHAENDADQDHGEDHSDEAEGIGDGECRQSDGRGFLGPLESAAGHGGGMDGFEGFFRGAEGGGVGGGCPAKRPTPALMSVWVT